MSFTAFMQRYIKPSRWWRRQKSIQVTIWPRFLAQALCPHTHKQTLGWDVAEKTITTMCLDCHKSREERSRCTHGEVSPSITEQINDTVFVRSYNCELCGVPLDADEVPKGARICPSNYGMNRGGVSL